MNKDNVYYISQYDGLIHNINDIDHEILYSDNKVEAAYVGCFVPGDGLRVDEEVDLYSVDDVFDFYNSVKIKTLKLVEKELYKYKDLISEEMSVLGISKKNWFKLYSERAGVISSLEIIVDIIENLK